MALPCLAILLFAALAWAQATPPPASPPQPKPATTSSSTAKPPSAPSSTVAPDAPLITIVGLCETPAAHPKAGTAAPAPQPCKTVITRTQFESLAHALQPNMNPATKRKLAEFYPKLLLMAQEARKRGVERDPQIKQAIEFTRLQVLARGLSDKVKEDAENVPEVEIAKYYEDNKAAFQEATLQRLFIPKDKQKEAGEGGDPAKVAEEQKASEEALKKEADALQTRAVTEDFDKLQKQAYDMAGFKSTPPNTNIGKLRRNELPQQHQSVMDLQPSQVSQVLTEPNGYYIYKVVSKDVKPLDQARTEIKGTLAQQRMQDAIQRIQDSGKTELNEAYFAVSAAGPGAAPAGPPAKPPETPKAPAQPPADPKN